MSALAQLQRDLQRHVLNGDVAIADAVNGTPAVPAATRLAVYSNAYRARLAEALEANMPHLRELLGAEEFGVVARRYIDAHPSQYASIRWFGDRLAHELERSHAAQPWIAELARWEWALAASFDAQDAATLGIESLGSVAPGDWAELRLEFHPSVQVLTLQTNAQALFKALSETQAGAATRGPRASAALAPLAAGPQDAVPFAGAGRNRRARSRARRRQLRRDVRGIVRMARGRRSAAGRRRHAQTMDRRGTPDRTGMKLYTFFRSSAAFRVRIALNLKGLQYESAPKHFARNEHRTRGVPGAQSAGPDSRAGRRRRRAVAVAGDHRIPE